MKIRVLALTGAAVLFAGAALADDPMANTYANSVVTKDKATGATSTMLFNQDSSFTAKGTDSAGKPVAYSGTWSVKDDGKTLCLAPAAAPNAPKAACAPLTTHNVGDSWTVTTDQNQTFDATITAGR